MLIKVCSYLTTQTCTCGGGRKPYTRTYRMIQYMVDVLRLLKAELTCTILECC